MARTSYAIALGSNRRHGRHGGPGEVLIAATRAIGAEGCMIVAIGPTLSTPPVGPAGRRFANGAAIIETALEPPALLRLLKRIERDFGRRGGRRWGPRVLDLDIVLWSGGRFASRALTIPHRALSRRRFVLDPLAAIAAGWRLPRSGLRVRHLAWRLARSG